MGRKKMLIKPLVKKMIIDSMPTQTAEYLYIAEGLGEKALKQILDDGGTQFSEIKNLTNKKKTPHYVVITAEKEEEGFLAITLLASIYNQRQSFCHFEEEDANVSHADYWEEQENRIPMISMDEAQSYYNADSDISGGFGTSMMLGKREPSQIEPYWREHTEMPICIRMTDMDLNRIDQCCDTLRYFDTNCQVYVLITRDTMRWGLFGMEENDDAIKNDLGMLVLKLTADEIDIPKNSSISVYYENVWKQMVRHQGYRLARNFAIKELLEDMEKMKNDFSYTLMEEILQYAIRDKSPSILKKEDFLFLERFVGKRRAGAKEGQRSAMKRLQEDLIGLSQVKEQVLEIVQVMKFNAIRKKMSISTADYHNVHVMLGAPGTAKTTVAKLMGEIMREEHLLPDCRFACVNGAELKGMYVGHSAPKTKSLFEENDVIVIDEAYSLVSGDGDGDSFSREAIAQLIIEIEAHSSDKLVIFAGYGGQDVEKKDNKMKEFIDANPGIRSRINTTFYFPSYSPKEMCQIFFKHANMSEYEIPEFCSDVIEEYFASRIKAENFGNGREARALFEKVSVQTAKRVMKRQDEEPDHILEEAELRQCTIEDVRKAIERMKEENQQLEGEKTTRKAIGF